MSQSIYKYMDMYRISTFFFLFQTYWNLLLRPKSLKSSAKAMLASLLSLLNTPQREPSAPRQGHGRVPFNRGEFTNLSLSLCLQLGEKWVSTVKQSDTTGKSALTHVDQTGQSV